MKKQLMTLAMALFVSPGIMVAEAKTFTWASSLDVLSMDPYSTNNSFTNAFMNNIYEGLVRFDEKVRIEPALAESWQSVSPTVWRFKLRHNVKFHNGEPFTADDVVFSWQRIQTPGSIGPIFEPIKNLILAGRGSDCRASWIAGRAVMEDFVVKGVSTDALRRDADAQYAKLMASHSARAFDRPPPERLFHPVYDTR